MKYGSDLMKVNELKAQTGVPEITLEIVTVAPPRAFSTARGSGVVASAAARDETGEVSLSLWNEQTKQVGDGDQIKIENGWCTEYKGNIQLSTGKQGKLTVIKKAN
ncbi:MAG: hypothetical protein HY917_04135 [Candidatus Diapherotrites archaeon]|nr:hypothetical protein [Candidatus Diapherotrites archaeon]